MAQTQRVRFKTLDGLELQGVLYPAQERGPGIVITPGFNCVKEMFIPQVAEQFQNFGITALIYDPRNLGESDGLPRNNVDPIMQVSDYSDAVSFMKTLPIVNREKVGIWGQSFAATIALCAAALDKRAKFVIAICPLLNFNLTPEKLPKVLARSMQDRESQLVGNEPTFIPVLTADGRNPAGMGLGATKDELDYMINAKSRGAPNYENRTTLQSYYKILMWQPHGIMARMDRTPVLMIVPAEDTISPPEEQLALAETFTEPKKVHVVPGKGHLDVLSGEDFPALAALQAEFVKKALDGVTSFD